MFLGQFLKTLKHIGKVSNQQHGNRVRLHSFRDFLRDPFPFGDRRSPDRVIDLINTGSLIFSEAVE
ncbi:MAG: hypothetical protein CMJ45_05375 [Planctomyces sp.]|nr:hypothetical protein [Planctomyces sp.]